MKIATWNINSLKVRLPQVLDWLSTVEPDFVGLQELKLDQDKFPIDAIKEAGYEAVWLGQKTYNGVAILSKTPAQDVVSNIPDNDDPQKRMIAATFETAQGPLRLINVYCPNGQSLESEKYPYKLAWFERLTNWLAREIEKYPNLAIVGDYNIAPTDEDVHDPKRWKNQVLVSPPEREAFERLLALGLTDSFRLFEQPERSFSWWDYRLNGYKRNAGLRIDHVLLTKPLADLCQSCVIDRTPRENEQPSDHAPVMATIG
ncbi:MAG TPA: exodeoxyribonuclease III [Orrella sp.]